MSANIPKLSRLSRSVWRILGCNPSTMTLQGTNVYLIGRGNSRILIDAGPKGFPDYVANLSRLLKQERTKVEHVILTHWHKDHVGGLDDLIPVFQESGVMPVVHKFPRLDKPDDPIPEKYHFKELEEGKLFSLEGCTLTAHFTPGHTTDHATIYFQEEGFAFVGDCMLGEGTGIFDDLYDYIEALRKIQALRPHKICPGHGHVIDDPIERVIYNIDHQLARERRVYGILKESAPRGLTPMDIVGEFYRGLSPGLQKQAMSNINHHLKKLVREKRVQEAQGKFSVNALG